MTRVRERLRRAFLTNSGGSAAVEFAIVIPVFLLCVMSVIQIGYFVYTQSIIAQLAEDGQRHLLFDPEDDFGARQVILGSIEGTGLDPKKLSISIHEYTVPINHLKLVLNYPFQFVGPFPLPDDIPIMVSIIVPIER